MYREVFRSTDIEVITCWVMCFQLFYETGMISDQPSKFWKKSAAAIKYEKMFPVVSRFHPYRLVPEFSRSVDPGWTHENINNFIHFSDTSPTSGAGFLQQTIDFLVAQGHGKLATVVGRYGS